MTDPERQREQEREDQTDRLWLPDNPDGSGWADVDWVSVARGTRYHYEHAPDLATARARQPAYYRVETRLESATLRPHANSYYVPREALADFVAELSLLGGAEIIWHIEPCQEAPPESRVPPAAPADDSPGAA